MESRNWVVYITVMGSNPNPRHRHIPEDHLDVRGHACCGLPSPAFSHLTAVTGEAGTVKNDMSRVKIGLSRQVQSLR